MNSFDGFGQDDSEPEVHRAEGGVFAAGALSVAFAGDDDSGQSLFFEGQASLGEGGFAFFVETVENVFGILGHVGAA